MDNVTCRMCGEEQLGPEALAAGWCVRCCLAWYVREKAKRRAYDKSRAVIRREMNKVNRYTRRSIIKRAFEGLGDSLPVDTELKDTKRDSDT